MTSSVAVSHPLVAEAAPVLMQVVGLAKSYRDQPALAEISFSIRSGEIVGLIGPNGAWVLSRGRVLCAAVSKDVSDTVAEGPQRPTNRGNCQHTINHALPPERGYIGRALVGHINTLMHAPLSRRWPGNTVSSLQV